MVAVFDGRSAFGSESAVTSPPNSSVMGVSAELLDQNVVAINIVAAFQEDGLAKAALQTLNDDGIRLGESVPKDSAARQAVHYLGNCRGFIPLRCLPSQAGKERLGHVRRNDAPSVGLLGSFPGSRS